MKENAFIYLVCFVDDTFYDFSHDSNRRCLKVYSSRFACTKCVTRQALVHTRFEMKSLTRERALYITGQQQQQQQQQRTITINNCHTHRSYR